MSKFRKKLQQHNPAIWTPRPEVLLDPPIPVPLSGTAPRVVMGSAWWDDVRKKALRGTDYHCIVCRVCTTRLECHERYEVDWLLGRATYLETVPLCHSCHSFIHPGFLKTQVRLGKVTRQEMENILERGREILRTTGLSRHDDDINRTWSVSVEWQEWRLVVEGKECPPLYDSLEEFRKAMGSQG